MVLTDPFVLHRSPRTAEATGRFVTRLPAPTSHSRQPRIQPPPPPTPEIPLRPQWPGWR